MVLAHDRVELVREREREPRSALAQRFADRAARAPGWTPTTAGTRRPPRRSSSTQPVDHVASQRRRVERPHDLSAVVDPLVDLERERSRHVRIGVLAGVLERQLATAHPEHQHVGMPGGGEKRRLAAVLRQDRIGRAGGAVDDGIAAAQQRRRSKARRRPRPAASPRGCPRSGRAGWSAPCAASAARPGCRPRRR